MGSGARVVGETFQEEICGGVRAAQRGWEVSGLILGGIKGDTPAYLIIRISFGDLIEE